MELSKRYQPSEVEGKLYHFWDEGNFFHAKTGPNAQNQFTIVILPPYYIERLHTGDALNNTLEDIMIRY